ncbi:glycosyltransferase [Maridesulfovibrio sp.]|uniref:glycosyltransferase n=1 Tax=Maridesulfovibrio sp. TaxID=2795000 RepID=UPI002A18B3D7|nr:glycosyltransferase [Maridesulfovibrio sp.]
MTHPFEIYSEQVLAFKLGGQDEVESFTRQKKAESTAARHLNYAEKRGAKAVVLFGLGAGDMAQILAESKPDDLELIICDTFPDHVRKMRQNLPDLFSARSNVRLLTDLSIWAMLLLLLQNGYTAENSHLVLNPELQGHARETMRSLQRIFSGLRTVPLPEKPTAPSISAAAILSPDEPDLDSFIKSFPEWLDEIILVWDLPEGAHPPELRHPHVPVTGYCHCLADNFGAQRNRMLEHCTGDWIIYLDADERLDSREWENLRKATAIEGCEGWFLPRLTLYPDKNNCRAGYGLWPDLQLRFFRNTGKLKFINRIHERIEGINGPSGILPGTPLRHLTHLLKSRKKIEAKLNSFNRAAEGEFSHRLGTELPHVDCSVLYPDGLEFFPAVILPEFNL